MITISIDPRSPESPSTQLKAAIMRAIVDGELAPASRLPSIRQLAGDLGLAANTVAKAYRELEVDGFVASNGRRGTVVLPLSAAAPEPIARQAADEFVSRIRDLGLDPATALSLVSDAFAR